LEVETPVLSRDTVIDRHIDPLECRLPTASHAAGADRPYYLQTSPEFGMKRLLAAGAPAIYQVARAFRAGEQGRWHNPEFTLVEWYRTLQSYEEAMSFTAALCDELLGCGSADRLSYAAAFQQHVGLDPHAASDAELAAACARCVPGGPQGLDRDGALNLLLATQVEPHLGSDRPTILFDYPASQAALARVRPGPPPVAERFELYFRGLELANGYHELANAEELRARFRRANAQRILEGKPPLPEESRLLSAMESGLPDCCGVALGFDRLVALAAGVSSLAEVLAFPFDRA
jgi:lysyl-tRNA synthetase class 2